jgi:hypothetical protein
MTVFNLEKKMFKEVRSLIIKTLWQNYRKTSWQMNKIETSLKEKGIEEIILDHFAIIDLPGPFTGIPYLCEIFSKLGFIVRGIDYLPDRQNAFCWMAEENSNGCHPRDVLPQVVVADFRLDALPPEIKKIITFYASYAKPSPIEDINRLIKRLYEGDTEAMFEIEKIIVSYLKGRDWPLPTVNEFYTVAEFNELLAWVLIFGRQPNHFTLSIHLLDTFTDLSDFTHFITNEVKLELNNEGDIIKGSQAVGIMQSSTKAYPETLLLKDGTISVPTPFVEFVWRYPRCETHQPLLAWDDYFTGFIGQQATQVIESLCD